MAIILCPGSHPRGWTHEFLAQLKEAAPELMSTIRVAPTSPGDAWSPYALRRWLQTQDWTEESPTGLRLSPLIFVAFSAGCVAAAGVAHYGSVQGHTVGAVIALDGWGVPIVGPFAVYRLSHDFITHQTTHWPRSGQGHFYADPPVPHRDLWRTPATVTGWQTLQSPNGLDLKDGSATTALQFLVDCLWQIRAKVTTPVR
ncbi:hypothetical protein [Leptolyngbya sp. PCC 6406]|uniref:hypothetical protein n=1 Tax=Leptolyngbya sp. PCC 6406 TaxID=1173264 RepID=UPI0002AC67E4|nr:hypothetical protein [Leptolyngbya sp. PCC 6406]